MKASVMYLILAVLTVFTATATADFIAGTSFENESLGSKYYDTGDPLSDHDLINNAGQSVVNSTASSTAAGDLGFAARFEYENDYSGMTDGADVGVMNTLTEVGYYPDGTQGYQIGNTDGIYILTFDPVDLTGWTNVEFSIQLFVNETLWETSDLIAITLNLDGTPFSLLDTTGQDIDYYYLEDQWNEFNLPIGDFTSSAVLEVKAWSEATTERFFIDDIQFTGEVPEPASMILLSIGTLLAMRRK